MPDFSTMTTKEMEERLGKFVFHPTEHNDEKVLIKKGPVELDNGCFYMGEWNVDCQREGRGVQIWRDGSKYEGHWKNDQVNGYGRLIHSTGESYTGDWINNMAQGRGAFDHYNGSKYVGEWYEDR